MTEDRREGPRAYQGETHATEDHQARETTPGEAHGDGTTETRNSGAIVMERPGVRGDTRTSRDRGRPRGQGEGYPGQPLTGRPGARRLSRGNRDGRPPGQEAPGAPDRRNSCRTRGAWGNHERPLGGQKRRRRLPEGNRDGDHRAGEATRKPRLRKTAGAREATRATVTEDPPGAGRLSGQP